MASNSRKVSECLILKYVTATRFCVFLGICTEKLDKILETLSQGGLILGRDYNSGPPRCKAGMPTNEPRCSVEVAVKNFQRRQL